ncbi:rhamnogalacturonan I rhamnosyltransferase 1-like [Senna tora]|uniref:O-fucosyltransferase family protein n=1 Tax=Senna tora TaxID=362788 RepID=A0A834TXA6_9FABA|nr:rhamnogalacturonan I rhamnosyltransferase 1-like [Senna tora]
MAGRSQDRCDKLPFVTVILRGRLRFWFSLACSGIVLWTCLVQLVTVGELWHSHLLSGITSRIFQITQAQHLGPREDGAVPAPSPFLPARNYTSNGFLRVSCNGGLNQMRAAICDMVTVARFLNLTLVVPELDKASFWADPSKFEDIFDVRHFIDSLRDEVQIVKRVPKRFRQNYGNTTLEMRPVSWSNEKYYMEQILPLFSKHKVLHFNKTDARLANNGLPLVLQKLRCHANYRALKFTPQIENLGHKLIQILQKKGPFMALHLRYEMDMLAFSGCTQSCTEEEAEELKRMRYAFPWWREKEIVSQERRLQGHCPLTPEEAALVLQALGFERETQIYIAAGEVYGGERRLAQLKAAFPRIVKKETLLSPNELQQFQNHSSQMAALDFMVSVASDAFVPTYDGNMAKLVEGHRRYYGFKRTILLDRKKLVELLDMHQNGTLSWNEFAEAVQKAHENRMGRPTRRRVIPDKPKEEDYFYANPFECLCDNTTCDDLLAPRNSSEGNGFTNLEAQRAPPLTCTGISKTKPITNFPKNENPNSQNQHKKMEGPPIYSGIGDLWKNSEVMLPHRLVPPPLSDQEQSDRHPGFQSAAGIPNFGSCNRVGVDPQPLGHLQNDLVSGDVFLGDEAEALRHDSGLDGRLGRDDAFVGKPLPEGVNGGRQ